MSTTTDNITLLVSSCDKYEDAWGPYFALIKKFWPEHPKNVCLITETKSFSCEGINIKVYNYDKSLTWSERLYRTLEKIDTKYIVFSLEDFFLLDYVKQDRIDECYNWMEENPDIAVCRLFSSNNSNLKQTEKYKDFCIADNTIGYRLETQVALWNRETLMSFIDLSEDPWQFESRGTERIKNTEKIFLWHYSEDLFDLEDKIFPYRMFPKHGYGIAWGHWLWENKKWFKQNGINTRYRLGVLSKKAVCLRMKYLYSKDPPKWMKVIKPLWRRVVQIRKIKANVAMYGIKDGLDASLKQIRRG